MKAVSNDSRVRFLVVLAEVSLGTADAVVEN